MARWIPLILRNALRNRRRTTLTILSIAAGFCLLGVLMAMYQMFFLANSTPDEALRLLTRHRVSITNFLPRAYQPRIKAVPGVVAVSTFQYFGGTYKDSRESKNNFARFGVDAPAFLEIYKEYRLADGQRQSFIRERNSCMVGRTLAERLGWKLGDHVHIQGDIFPVTLDVIVRAIYDSEVNNEGFFFHLEYLTEGTRFRDVAGMYVLLVDRPESVSSVSATIDAMFRNSTAQSKTESEKAMQLSFLSYLGNVKMFLLSVCSALTLAVLMVAANTMGMSARERTRESGVLKTLGFSSNTVLALMLGEAAIIAVVGALVGLALASGILAALRTLPSYFVDMKGFQMHYGVAALSLLLAAVEGLASAWFPARRAARLPIVEALATLD